MSYRWRPHLTSPAPICIGTGLNALDVIIDDVYGSPVQMAAGGSCANVLAILAYLGWRSFPITLFGTDHYSSSVIEDLARFNVETELITRESTARAPIIVERLFRMSSGNRHVFQFKCPNCGSPLPRNRPFPTRLLERLFQRMPRPQVYYFDRVSKSSLAIAVRARELGAVVMFEPAKATHERLLRKCVGVSHIVKYSVEQLPHAEFGVSIPLEIQTLGSEGLLYRIGTATHPEWTKSDSFPISNPVDTAGAGDWCSAGILYELGQQGQLGFGLTKSRVERAIQLGQALAATNCFYVGARGAAYKTDRFHFQEMVLSMMKGVSHDSSLKSSRSVGLTRGIDICPKCTVRGPPQASRLVVV